MAQPAERMRAVPPTKMRKMFSDGWPAVAIQSAQSVGHSSSQMPIGRCRRTSSAYSRSVLPTRSIDRRSEFPTGIRSAHLAVFTADPDPARHEGRYVIRIQVLHQHGCALHAGQQIRIAQQIRYAHFDQACLARSEELARSTKFKVLARDFESVVGRAQQIGRA